MSGGGRPQGRLSFTPSLAAKLRASPCDFVITGGSGWIGQAVVEMLEQALGDDLPPRVFIFGAADRPLQLRSGRSLPCRTLHHIATLNDRPKLLIHCAFLTKDKLADQSIESFINGNRAISDSVATAFEQQDVRGLFMPSSGAVYKKGTHMLDDDAQNNAYGVLKRADEQRFMALAQRKNIPFCMPRLFNLSGPFINKHELYALASMIQALQDNRPITIRATHHVVRSFIHVADLVTLAFAMMLDPHKDDQAIFDTAGDQALEMSDLADAVRQALGQPEHPIQRGARSPGNDDVYVGDATPMRRMMAAHGLSLTPLDQQIRDTAVFMQSCRHA